MDWIFKEFKFFWFGFVGVLCAAGNIGVITALVYLVHPPHPQEFSVLLWFCAIGFGIVCLLGVMVFILCKVEGVDIGVFLCDKKDRGGCSQ